MKWVTEIDGAHIGVVFNNPELLGDMKMCIPCASKVLRTPAFLVVDDGPDA